MTLRFGLASMVVVATASSALLPAVSSGDGDVDPAGVTGKLARIEADPVRADPREIEAILLDCRTREDRPCQARALLARAELHAESGMVEAVARDAAAAEALLRDSGERPADLARALLLMRGSGAGGGQAAAETARQRYAEALELAEGAGDLSTAGRLHCEWAKVEAAARNWSGFGAHLESASALAARARLPRVAGCLAYQQGLSRYLQRDPAGARRIWIGFADSDLAEDAPRELLWILVGASAASIDMAEHGPALRRARQAVDLAATLQGEGDGVGAWCNLSTALYFHHRLPEAVEAARACMEKGRRAGRPETEAVGLLRLGQIARERGRLSEGAGLLRRSLQVAREHRVYPQLPWILLTLGEVLTDLGKVAEARVHLEEALDLADRFGPAFQRSAVRSVLSRLSSITGDHEQGLLLAGEALELLAAGGGTLLKVQAHRARGLARMQAQSYEAALADFDEACALAHAEGAPQEEARAAIEAGNTLYYLNRLDLALERFRAARALAASAGARDLQALAAGNLALLKQRGVRSTSDPGPILRLAEEAAENSEGRSRIVALINLAVLQRSLERFEEARASADEALVAALEGGEPDLVANARTQMALALSGMGRGDEAARLCREVLARTDSLSENMRMRGEYRCGVVHLDRGEPAAAVELLRRAVGRAEAAGRRLARPGLRAAYTDDRAGFYAALLEALLAGTGGAPSPAQRREMLSISERFRARLLLEAPGEAGARDSGEPGGAGLDKDLGAALPEGTAAVEYLLGPRASFAFLVTRADVRLARLPPKDEIDEPVMVYKGLLERRGREVERDLQAISMAGLSLHRMLLKPVLPSVTAGLDRLVIIPDGSLHRIPFEALVTGRAEREERPRYLVESLRVSTAPSLTFLIRKQASERPSLTGPALVAFANPVPASAGPGGDPLRPGASRRLPHSESEVRGVAARIGGGRSVLTGAAASEAALRRALGLGAVVVHVAAHGYLDPVSFGRSGIFLSPSGDDDGLLEAREIAGLEVNAGLIVLSGCSTGSGRLLRGEGFIGLPHALLQAGARSIVMSLWAVGDRSAALVMDRFYEGLVAGRPVGEALRRAKLDLLGSGEPLLSHPAVWAPFVTAGVEDEKLDLRPPAPRPFWRSPAVLLAAAAMAGACAILLSRKVGRAAS